MNDEIDIKPDETTENKILKYEETDTPYINEDFSDDQTDTEAVNYAIEMASSKLLATNYMVELEFEMFNLNENNYLFWTENRPLASKEVTEARTIVKEYRNFESSFQQIEQMQQEVFAVQFESKLNHPPIELPPNPKNLDEALSSRYLDLWIAAVEKELGQFDDRKIFSPAPSVGRAMKSKLILIYNYNNDYSIKCKARLVACGYSQIKGLDYNEVFAPTTETSTAYLLILKQLSLKGIKM